MRPVNKGVAPNIYADYRDAADDLQGRVGDYCSYCERQIETHLAVEHIQPKSRNKALRTAWSNFLLACHNCNSSKGKKKITLAEYYWPDVDNTLRAVQYNFGGLVHPHPALVGAKRAKALQTIRLTGLDKDPGNPDIDRRPTSRDKRWKRRLNAWTLATHYKRKLASNNSPDFREAIVEIALGRGMFSIWWTVFAGDKDMRRRLRLGFLGTESDCFNVNEDAICHPTGVI